MGKFVLSGVEALGGRLHVRTCKQAMKEKASEMTGDSGDGTTRFLGNTTGRGKQATIAAEKGGRVRSYTRRA